MPTNLVGFVNSVLRADVPGGSCKSGAAEGSSNGLAVGRRIHAQGGFGPLLVRQGRRRVEFVEHRIVAANRRGRRARMANENRADCAGINDAGGLRMRPIDFGRRTGSKPKQFAGIFAGLLSVLQLRRRPCSLSNK